MRRCVSVAAAQQLARHSVSQCRTHARFFSAVADSHPSTSAPSAPSSPSQSIPASAATSFSASPVLPTSSSSAPSSPPRSAASVPRNSTLDSILRVDHAGEYGAQCIYEGQLAALKLRSAMAAPSSPLSVVSAILQSATGSAPHPSSSQAHIDRSIAVIDEMRVQEVEHLNALSALVPRHRCRPTMLLPLWHVAGYALGYGTALLGTRAAMACTVAVEEVITEHYNDQLRTLATDEWKEPGEQWDEQRLAEMVELRALIRKNRDDEEHHRDVGIEHEAEQTPLYSLITSVIKTGCQAAIAVAKKV